MTPPAPQPVSLENPTIETLEKPAIETLENPTEKPRKKQPRSSAPPLPPEKPLDTNLVQAIEDILTGKTEHLSKSLLEDLVSQKLSAEEAVAQIDAPPPKTLTHKVEAEMEIEEPTYLKSIYDLTIEQKEGLTREKQKSLIHSLNTKMWRAYKKELDKRTRAQSRRRANLSFGEQIDKSSEPLSKLSPVELGTHLIKNPSTPTQTEAGALRFLKMQETTNQKRLLAQALDERLKRQAHNDIDAFCLYVFGWENDWFHREWHKAVDKTPYTLIISPRDHGKSSQMSVARVLYELGKNPNLRVKIVSQSDDRASNLLSEIVEHIRTNKRLHVIFPDMRPAQGKPWTQHKIYIQRQLISKDPSIESLGILSTATGARADLIVFDDVVDFRNAIQNPKLRDVVKEAFFSVWVNLLEASGRLIYICTLWHRDDLSHALITMDAYNTVFYSIPAGSFDPIWEEHWPREALEKRCEEIGLREFDRSFRNIALSAEDTLFNEEFIKSCYVATECPSGLKLFAGVDLAAGFGKKAKYNVLFTLGVDRIGRKWRKEILRGKFTSPQFAKLIISAYDRLHHQVIMVENNAYQQAMIDWFGELGRKDVPIKGFTTGKNKLDLNIGLPSIAVEFQNKAWAIPRAQKHAPTCLCNDCIWINELTSYPIGKTSDIIMAQWLAREGARKFMNFGGYATW